MNFYKLDSELLLNSIKKNVWVEGIFLGENLCDKVEKAQNLKVGQSGTGTPHSH